MIGFCRNKKSIDSIDLYLTNDYICFESQCDHIKKCFSSKIDGNKTGLLIEEQKGEMIISLFKYDGLHTISDICIDF